MFFSINFEAINLFNLDIDYLASKISVGLLFFVSILNFKISFAVKNLSRILMPILIYFILLTLISFNNRTVSDNVYFDVPLFVNILLFVILINYSKIDNNILLKGLYVFSLGAFVLSILYFLNVGVTEKLMGRFSMFGMSKNMLGLTATISIFVLFSIIIENKLQWGNKRYLLLALMPFIFWLIIISGSRVAFISLILGFVLYYYFDNSKNKAIILFSGGLIALLMWEFFLKSSLIIQRLSDSINYGDLSARDLIWIKIIPIIEDNLLYGIGKTGYSKEMNGFFGAGLVSPHNVIIETLAYTGLLGLFVMLIFFIKIGRVSYFRMKKLGEYLPLLLISPLVGMLLSGQIYEIKAMWVIFAYISSVFVAPKLFKELY